MEDSTQENVLQEFEAYRLPILQFIFDLFLSTIYFTVYALLTLLKHILMAEILIPFFFAKKKPDC
jgi:hypothetical protein